MRRERQARLERQGTASLGLDSGSVSGRLVIEADGVSFSYGDETIVRDFSTTILRGDRVGVIGPNGSGKSTLLKLLLGELQPSEGSVRRGTKLELAYFDQERMQLDPERSVRDNVADGADQVKLGDKSRHVISYLRDFLFPPERVNSPVKTLSGGERNRLLLARLFSKPANFLVLDEPTNDLDVETLELLEELLTDFEGTLLLVSHDRAFLDQTVTSTLVLEGGGRVGEYVGGYSDWKRQVGTSPAEAGTPAPEQASKDKKPRRVRSRPAGLSYKEERELQRLPERIEELEAAQALLTTETSSADFYQQDQDSIAAALKKLADVSDELEQAYARWSELEEAKAQD
jgi:ATP-binding cassette subfamily F protein uup